MLFIYLLKIKNLLLECSNKIFLKVKYCLRTLFTLFVLIDQPKKRIYSLNAASVLGTLQVKNRMGASRNNQLKQSPTTSQTTQYFKPKLASVKLSLSGSRTTATMFLPYYML